MLWSALSKWQAKELDDKMNKNLGFGEYKNEHEKPSWYTQEWPSNCQYNNPGCSFGNMETSRHDSSAHAQLVRDNQRWKDLLLRGQTEGSIIGGKMGTEWDSRDGTASRCDLFL